MSERKADPGLAAASIRARLPFADAPAPAPVTGTVPLPVNQDAPEAQPHRAGRPWLKLSAALVILLPTLLTGLYYAFIAADQYAVEVRFAVRGPNNKAGTDLLGAFTGAAAAGSTVVDSYIVMDFIRSREIIDNIKPSIDIRAIYSHRSADIIAALPVTWPIEDVLRYWRNMIEVSFDASSQIITFKVRAFTREDAKLLAEAVIKQSEDLINSLSERARLDAIRTAMLDVEKSENRLKQTRATVREFRNRSQEIDPLKTAEAQLAQIARLEAELATTRGQVETQMKYMKADAPTVVFLRSKIAVLEQQIAEERRRLGPGITGGAIGTSGSLSGTVGEYEELVVEREFAEKAYVSALASLERARIEAVQQQRFLATFVNPKLPDYALYPRRVVNTLIVLGGSFVLWALGLLLVYGIRDHAS